MEAPIVCCKRCGNLQADEAGADNDNILDAACCFAHGTRIISRSNETTMLVFDAKNGVREVATPGGDTILTEARARRLGEAVDQIIPLFPRDAPLDVEWVLEGEKIWLVQARPYVTKPSK